MSIEEIIVGFMDSISPNERIAMETGMFINLMAENLTEIESLKELMKEDDLKFEDSRDILTIIANRDKRNFIEYKDINKIFEDELILAGPIRRNKIMNTLRKSDTILNHNDGIRFYLEQLFKKSDEQKIIDKFINKNGDWMIE